MNILENFFSVKNNKTQTHKIITILGLTIKFRIFKKIQLNKGINKLPLAHASGITCSELRSPCPKASQA